MQVNIQVVDEHSLEENAKLIL